MAMKFCSEHWSHLRDELRKQNLEPLFSSDAIEAINRIDSILPDPLLWSHNVIFRIAKDLMGQQDGCPVCNLEKFDLCKETANQARMMLEGAASNATEN